MDLSAFTMLADIKAGIQPLNICSLLIYWQLTKPGKAEKWLLRCKQTIRMQLLCLSGSCTCDDLLIVLFVFLPLHCLVT